jgi:Mg-chelatase subunit ChlD
MARHRDVDSDSPVDFSDLWANLFAGILLLAVGLAALLSLVQKQAAARQMEATAALDELSHKIAELPELQKRLKASEENAVALRRERHDLRSRLKRGGTLYRDALATVKRLNEHIAAMPAASTNPSVVQAERLRSVLGFNGKGKHVVILVDRSGSMMGINQPDPEACRAQWRLLKERLKKLLREFPMEKFTVITFSGHLRAENWQRIEHWSPELVEATMSNRLRACDAVDGWQAEGGTPCVEALTAAYAIAGATDIWYFGDGRPSVPGDQERTLQLVEQNAAWNPQITLNTIAVGNYAGQDPEGLELLAFLRQLATAGHGSFQGW